MTDRVSTYEMILALRSRAEAAEAEVARLREALNLQPGWSLETGYHDGDEDGDYGWLVFEARGGVNDREWREIAFGETPLDALEKAHAFRAALASKEEGGR